MSLALWEVKARLGHGAGREIAKALGKSEGKVSEVTTGRRADREVAVVIARRLKVRLADLPDCMYVKQPAPLTALATANGDEAA